MSRYYLIDIPAMEAAGVTLAALKKYGDTTHAKASIRTHWRTNIAKTKIIVEGNLTGIEKTFLSGKAWITDYGENEGGKGNAAISKYLSDNSLEWDGK